MKLALSLGILCLGSTLLFAGDVWDGGAANNNWNTAANWDPNGVPAAGSSLTFAGTVRLANTNNLAAGTQFNGLTFAVGAGAFTLGGNLINLGGNVTNLSSNLQTITLPLELLQDTTFDAGAGLTVSGAISGAFAMTKTGLGTLILSGANSYGETVISAGILQVGNGGTAGTLGAGAVTNNASLAFNRSDAFTVANDIGGTGSVTQSGTGNTTLTGTNSYSGTTTVNAGTLTIAGTNTGAGTITVRGVLDLGGGTAGGTINSSGTVVLNQGTLNYTRTDSATQAVNLTLAAVSANHISAVAGNTLNLGAIAVGSQAFADFSGAGTITTTHLNNSQGILGSWATFGGISWATVDGGGIIQAYTGYTLSSVAGTTAANYDSVHIDVDANQTLDGPITPFSLRYNTAGARTLTLTGVGNQIGSVLVTANVGANTSTIAGGTLMADSAGGEVTLVQNNLDGALLISSIIADNGSASSLVKSGGGRVILSSANTYTGTTFITNGTLQIGNAGTTGSIASASVVNNGNLTFSRSNAHEYTGVISGTGSVTKAATAGVLTLSNANTYTGGTTIAAGGQNILRVTHDKALGTGNVTIGATSSANQNATLQLAGNIQLDLGVTGGVANRITTNGGSASANNPHIENLSGENSYLGEVYVLGPLHVRSTAGKITLGSINLNYSSGTTETGPRPLQLSGAGDGEITGRIYNSGTRRFNLTVNSTGTWTFSNAGTGTSARNDLNSITITSGTLVLSGGETDVVNNSVVNAGALLVNGSLNSAAVNVNATGTLGGDGIVGGAATFAAGSFLSPGETAGTAGILTFNNAVDISGLAGGTDGGLKFQLGTTADQIVLTSGVLTIGSGLLDINDFDFVALSGFGVGTYTLFDTTQTITGSLGSNLTAVLGSYNVELRFANSNQDLVLSVTAIPEPSTVLLLGLGALALGVRRFRRGTPAK